MEKFKVGDRVRCVKFDGVSDQDLVGQVGTVAEIKLFVEVRLDSGNYKGWEHGLFNENELELIPTFTVGQKVRVKADAEDTRGDEQDLRGCVVEISRGVDAAGDVCILRTDGGGWGSRKEWFVPEAALGPYEEPVAAPAEDTTRTAVLDFLTRRLPYQPAEVQAFAEDLLEEVFDLVLVDERSVSFVPA